SPVYAFFHAVPEIEFGQDDKPAYLIYCCTNCAEKIRQGWSTGDRGSTGNLREHVRKCWGDDALAAIKDSTLEQARAGVKELSKGKQTTLTTVIKTVSAWFKTFSTHLVDRVVTARWVAESARPFRIVEDRSYRWLQKEGRPKHYVPSKVTVARDMKKLYRASKEQLAKDLQAYEYLVPIELDCWSSPNH
ncbi:hypothetical protein EV360DRAFT_2061, partial [Lentinula raphanica]